MKALINRLARFSLVLALITAGYGCDVFLPDKGNEGQPCLDNGGCKPGLVCQDGKCVEGSTDGGQGCETNEECEDDNPCTADLCVEGNCSNTDLQNGTPCNDGDTCTANDACQDGSCAGSAKDCSNLDGLCKKGVCFPDNGECVQISADDGDTCNDGLYCTTGDQCLSGDCVGTPLDCDDSDDCTADSCNETEDTCQNVLDPGAGTTEGPVGDATCSNQVDDDCDGKTDLEDSECVACTGDGDCDDGNACTTDTCNTGQCTYQDAQNGTSCDDGLYCTVADACLNGVCTGSARDCRNLTDDCNDGVCSETQDNCVTQPKANGTPCDDGLYCTVPDQCDNGVCQLNTRNCDDADSCTLDRCDEDNDVCENTLNPNPGAEGPQGDATCSNGVDDDCDRQTDLDDPDCVDCQTGSDCDDANDCTLDECQAGGCTNTPQTGQTCDDGNPCTHTDQCTGAGACQGTTIACVDDPPPCGVVKTCNGTDTCDESYPTVTCDDSNDCTYADRCDGAGTCTGTTVVCQDDPAVCGVKKSCNGTDTCDETWPGAETSCDDTNPCTYNDVCEGTGVCVGSSVTCQDDPPPCGATRACNGTATCDENYPGSATGCEDGLFCTSGDRCDGAGKCEAGSIAPCGLTETCWEDEDQCCEPDVAQICGANDNDVHWADSCGHEGDVYANCPDPNGECVNDACQCIPHWTGQLCDACEDGWAGSNCDVCVRYVDKNAGSGGNGLTWATAYTDVQTAINRAHLQTQVAGGPEFCDVWVAAGTYYIYQTARTDTVLLKSGVRLSGGFTTTMNDWSQRNWETNLTVLNGWNQSMTNQVNSVVTGADKSTIDGFLITGGNASSSGGGMYNDTVSPTVANCVFLENNASVGGGMFNYNNSAVIRDCHFTGNSATWGCGMNNLEASPLIRRCIFAGNVGSNSGGIRSVSSGGYINNSLFVGNVVVQSAASLQCSGETIANCTFYGNSPGGSTNSIGVAGNPDFRNCILWDTGAGDQTPDLAGADVRYSAVYVAGGIVYQGTGNIKDNPNFTIVEDSLIWTGVSYGASTYQTKLTVLPRDWNIGELKGMAVRPSTQSFPWYIIVDNSADSVYVWGDLSGDVQAGMGFMIVDLNPPDRSPVVDAADRCSAPITDLYERGRLSDPNSPDSGVGPPWVDMGALERQCCSTAFPVDMLLACCGNPYPYDTHDYHVCTDQVPWATAAFRCNQYGANLATAVDANENSHIAGLVTANIWLGANDVWEEGLFWWVTNEPWSWDNFDTGQPDNSDNEDCVEMKSPSGRWQDTSCEYNRAFVCERPN